MSTNVKSFIKTPFETQLCKKLFSGPKQVKCDSWQQEINTLKYTEITKKPNYEHD